MGALASTRDLFLLIWQWKHKKSVVAMSGFVLLDIILTQWQRPVASSKALDLLHQAMRGVLYWCTTAAMNMATFLGVFVDCCLFACCPGGCWGDMEQVVTRWWLPGASSVALDLLHWAMPRSSLQRVHMAIKMACNGGTFGCHCWFYHRP
jgi:hypothetical protein